MTALRFLSLIVLPAGLLSPARHLARQEQGKLQPVATLLGQTGLINGLALSSNGMLLVTGSSEGSICLWDMPRRRLLAPALEHGAGEERHLQGLNLSPNAKYLASVGGGRNGSVFLWDVAGRKLVRQRGTMMYPCAAAFSPDGELLAVIDFFSLYLFDVASWKAVHVLPIDRGFLSSVAFSPDGKMLATAGYGFGHIRLWDPVAGKEVRRLTLDRGGFSSMAFSKDGKKLFVGSSDRPVTVWDPETGKKTTEFTEKIKGPVRSLAASTDGKLVATYESRADVSVWGVGSGKQLLRLPRHTANVFLSFSNDSRLLITTDSDSQLGSRIMVWDIRALLKAGQE
jgi:WD40 repeat protein